MKLKVNFNTASMVLAAIVLLEGAAIAANARQVNGIQSLHNGFFASTVMMIGVQLLVIGLVAFLALLLSRYVNKRMKKLNKALSWVPVLAGAAVLVEGLVVILYASPITNVAGYGKLGSHIMAAMGAQLFILGVGLVLFKLFTSRQSLKLLVRLSLFIILAAAGLFIIGIAEHAFITGIGNLAKDAAQIVGAQLFALSMTGIVLMWLEERKFMQRKVYGHRLGALTVIGIAFIICMEGLILASLAAPFSIKGIGGMLEQTMMIAGLMLTFLGLLIPASYYFFEKTDYDVRKISSSACLFLVFLLPFALLV